MPRSKTFWVAASDSSAYFVFVSYCSTSTNLGYTITVTAVRVPLYNGVFFVTSTSLCVHAARLPVFYAAVQVIPPQFRCLNLEWAVCMLAYMRAAAVCDSTPIYLVAPCCTSVTAVCASTLHVCTYSCTHTSNPSAFSSIVVLVLCACVHATRVQQCANRRRLPTSRRTCTNSPPVQLASNNDQEPF